MRIWRHVCTVMTTECRPARVHGRQAWQSRTLGRENYPQRTSVSTRSASPSCRFTGCPLVCTAVLLITPITRDVTAAGGRSVHSDAVGRAFRPVLHCQPRVLRRHQGARSRRALCCGCVVVSATLAARCFMSTRTTLTRRHCWCRRMVARQLVCSIPASELYLDPDDDGGVGASKAE